jgi:hypothetical protein
MGALAEMETRVQVAGETTIEEEEFMAIRTLEMSYHSIDGCKV